MAELRCTDSEVTLMISAMKHELENCVMEISGSEKGTSEELISIYLLFNERLAEIVKRHRRHLLHANGQDVPPETHDSGVIHLLPATGGF